MGPEGYEEEGDYSRVDASDEPADVPRNDRDVEVVEADGREEAMEDVEGRGAAKPMTRPRGTQAYVLPQEYMWAARPPQVTAWVLNDWRPCV